MRQCDQELDALAMKFQHLIEKREVNAMALRSFYLFIDQGETKLLQSKA